MPKKKPHVEDTEFFAGQIGGQSKDARKARAELIATLGAQDKLFVVSGLKKTPEGKNFAYAVVFGDEEQDGQRACNFADILNNFQKLARENEELRKSLSQLQALMANGGQIVVNLPSEERNDEPPASP